MANFRSKLRDKMVAVVQGLNIAGIGQRVFGRRGARWNVNIANPGVVVRTRRERDDLQRFTLEWDVNGIAVDVLLTLGPMEAEQEFDGLDEAHELLERVFDEVEVLKTGALAVPEVAYVRVTPLQPPYPPDAQNARIGAGITVTAYCQQPRGS